MMTFFSTLRSFGAATQSENFAAYAAGGKQCNEFGFHFFKPVADTKHLKELYNNQVETRNLYHRTIELSKSLHLRTNVSEYK